MNHYPLKISFNAAGHTEAGVDEAGRGCLCGPVFAAAVVLSKNPPHSLLQHLNDSKKLSEAKRNMLRQQVEAHALAWAVGIADQHEIDEINILNASHLAMHRAIAKLNVMPALLLIDGNRFKPYDTLAHHCIIKGDGLYYSIAAASVLAKTWRDEFMLQQHLQYPHYGWDKNKGYPTKHHREAIQEHGLCPLHRRSFNSAMQMKMKLRVQSEKLKTKS